MIALDKKLNVYIDVAKPSCIDCDCYWPRACKESFIPLRGNPVDNWICLNYETCDKIPKFSKDNVEVEDYPIKKKKVITTKKKVVMVKKKVVTTKNKIKPKGMKIKI